MRVTKTGDRIHFDFSGSDPQTKGPVNIRPPLVRACCYYALVALIDPTLPTNEGLQRVAETTFAESSVLNPTLPAPCNSYFQTASAVVETLLTALVEDRRRGSLMSLTVALGQVGFAAGGALAGPLFTIGYWTNSLLGAVSVLGMGLIVWFKVPEPRSGESLGPADAPPVPESPSPEPTIA